MSNNLQQIKNDFIEAMSAAGKPRTSAYDTTAEVTRIEDGTAWVHIPGGVEETPADLSVNALPGDTVQVRVAGGRAWITGNNTAPPTDDRIANLAIVTANSAEQTAGSAAEAANQAFIYADSAQAAAANAQTSARTANVAANNALIGLATIEDVVDIVNWFADHKKATTDTTVDPTKTYYIYDENTGVLTKVDPEGTENPSAEGWYEMTEAVTEYVTTHVATSTDGLSIIGAADGWRVLVSAGTGNYSAGVFLIDPNGNIAQSTTGSGISFNDSKPFYIGDDSAYIVFNGNGGITIGGTGVSFGSKTLTQVLADLDSSLVAVEYGVGNSPTSHSDISTWSSASPTWTEGKYIWMRTTTNGSTYTYTCIQGAQGPQGPQGEAGTAAYSYELIVSHAAVVLGEDGTYSPTSITLTAKRGQGTATAPADYSGRFKIETTTNYSTWTSRYTSSSNESSKSYTIPSGVIAIRCSLYLAGGTTTLLDQQTVPVVSDGADGEDAYTVILTNENHSFAGSATAAVQGSTTTSVIAYKGATQIAATIGTISGAPTGMTATAYNSGTTSAYINISVTTSMTSANGVLTIPVTVDGKTFTKLFTYSIAFKGTQGEQGEQGNPGADAISAWCGNEAVTIACGTDRKALAASTITIPFTAYKGTARIAASVSYSTLPSGVTRTSNTAGTTSADGSLVLSVASGATLGGTTTAYDNVTITLIITAENLTFTKNLTLSKSIKGETGSQGPQGDPGGTGATGPEAVVSVYITDVNWETPSATLTATLMVDGSPVTSGLTYKWTRGTSTTPLGTNSTYTVSSSTYFENTYHCTITWSGGKQSGSINLKAARQAYMDAKKKATNYMTDVTGNQGVFIHEESSTDVQPDSANANGVWIRDTVDVIRDGESVAEYGESTRIGRSGESHAELDYHSFQMIDADDSTYFHVSDLRDDTGYATLTENFKGNGTETHFDLSNVIHGIVEVIVDGDTVSSSAYTYGNGDSGYIDFTTAPTTSVIVTYTTDAAVRSLTFGSRAANSLVGADSVTFGERNVASGAYSVSSGFLSEATGYADHAEGHFCIASGGWGSHAEGVSSVASGQSSHAEGQSTASGWTSHAEGDSTASGDLSHAEGQSTAQGDNSHAENLSTAYGPLSHAEGMAEARGNMSHAEGNNSLTLGTASHAEGSSTAVGDYSHAQNYNTIASSNYQTVIGKYNVEDANDTYAFIIGNGTSSTPSNAFAVKWDGTIVSSTIGTVVSSENSSATSIPNTTGTAVTSIQLGVGTWIVVGKCRFSSNSTGYRRLNISTTSGATSINVSSPPASNTSTDLQVTQIITRTSTATYYLNAYQNSGTSLSCESGQGTLTAIRIV